MSGSEKLCLQWNDYRESIVASFGALKVDKDLIDVTLVCEDGQQVEAHKMVLASSSPFFMNLLKNTKHARPLIYMRGLKTNDLTTILNFLYVGEANIFQEDLDSFLALAEELQLKGLTGDSTRRTEDLKYFKRDIETRGEMLRPEQRSLQPKSNINTALKQNLTQPWPSMHYGIRADILKKAIRKCLTLKIDFSANFNLTHDFFWAEALSTPQKLEKAKMNLQILI